MSDGIYRLIPLNGGLSTADVVSILSCEQTSL